MDESIYATELVEYRKEHKQMLYDLSVEWLEKYVSVEPEDIRLLNDPQGTIIDKGGFIYFAKVGDEFIGTVSLIKKSDKVYELAKLAVTEKAKGRGIGNVLMKKCVETCIAQKAQTMILYTNRKLVPAIKLYEKFGFVEVKPKENKYLEADMYMEKKMKKL